MRKARNLTQEQLAEMIDRSQDAISNIERGISLPNFETLERLAIALNVGTRDFFDFEEEVTASPERIQHLAEITDMARQLSDDNLKRASDLIGVLSKDIKIQPLKGDN